MEAAQPFHARRMQVQHLGQGVDFALAEALQKRCHEAVCRGADDDTLLLLEHAHVITCGRNTQPGHVLLAPEALATAGVAYFETGRGGDVTYHGPGQLVGYPIFHLVDQERDVRRFVWRIEEVLIRCAADFGVTATRVAGLRGIWVGNDKLAAIGIRLARWTTSHGFALNVSTDLTPFSYIVPCGLHGRGVTSLEKILATQVPMDAVEASIVGHMADLFERAAVPAGPPKTDQEAFA